MPHTPEMTPNLAVPPQPLGFAGGEVIDRLNTANDATYNSMRLVEAESEWNEAVQRVVVVLSASRSGSSLLFKALSSANEVVAPAGEHEPWLFLSGNKYPFTPSDQILQPQDTGRLLHLLRNDLLVRDDKVSGGEFGDLLHNRLAVRGLRTQAALAGTVASLRETPVVDERMQARISTAVSAASASQKPLIRLGDIGDSTHLLPVENPPYIDQPLARRATLDELGTKALLFKSPPDAYRPGLYESLFPNAQITYVHLTRGFVQTVNGLMDGWSKNEVDFISNPVGLTGNKLDIEGYSDSDVTQAYWCFDLFPDWQSYRDVPLVEVCAQQWLQAHHGIVNNFAAAGRVTFESFYTHRGTFYEGIEAATGINLRGYDWSEEVMATEPPSQFRWLKREQLFRRIGEHLTVRTLGEVVDMQEKLGYSMEASTWH